MTAQKRTPRKTTAASKPTAKAPTPATSGPEKPEKSVPEQDAISAPDGAARCNVTGCRRDPKTLGLCDPHWGTHRGLADPSEKRKENAGA